MNKLPKVLVATCTYEGKHYTFMEWWKRICELQYPAYDILIVDNSKGDDYYFKLIRLTQGKAKVIKAPRLENSRDTLSYSQNIIRKHLIENDYDYWMSIESDVIPPKNVITNLMKWYKPVCGGLYEIGFKEKVGRRWCIFFRDKKPNGMMGTRIINEQENPQFANIGLRQVHGCGIGCTLIRSDIFRRFPMWTDCRFNDKHSDVYFYMDLDNNNIPVFVDTSVICEHNNSDWCMVADR